jgi:hypothetical protein
LRTSFPFGKDALGSLHYAVSAQRGGIMIAQLSAQTRAPLCSDAAPDDRAQQKIAAFDSYVAYSGLWRIEGDCVIHRVKSSLYPNWVGTDLLRRVRFRDDLLILSTVPQSRDSATHRLSWRRA